MYNLTVQLTKITGGGPFSTDNRIANQLLNILFAAINIALSVLLFFLQIKYSSGRALLSSVTITSCFIQIAMSYDVLFSVDSHYEYLSLIRQLDIIRASFKSKARYIENALIFILSLHFFATEMLLGFPTIPYKILYIYNNFIIFINFLQRIIVLERIKHILQYLNKRMKNNDWNFANMDQFVQLYEQTNRLIDLYNDLFGWPSFLFVIYIVLLTLEAAQGMILFGLGDEWDEFLHISVAITQLAILCIQSNGIEELGQETVQLANAEARKYVTNPFTNNKVFSNLVRATKRIPEFSAAGFFNLNNALLFNMFNLSVTYVIACVQFTKVGSGSSSGETMPNDNITKV